MPENVGLRLRSGMPLDDADFDRLYPEWAREHSAIHWTPVQVARRAAELLVVRPGTRVLDVGSGVGKFCLIGALHVPGVFYGIEQRFHFVKVAHDLAQRLGLSRARFLHGNMLDAHWAGFDAFYLYNPFAENIASMSEAIDTTVERSPLLFRAYIQGVRERLDRARRHTRVVTYHGFGGEMPPDYRLELEEHSGTEVLELWVKAR
jgi:SAM-dependent methyltransferase